MTKEKQENKHADHEKHDKHADHDRKKKLKELIKNQTHETQQRLRKVFIEKGLLGPDDH
jgi:hypothetical protein